MTICIPPDTDWGCAYSDDEITTMRADAATADKMHVAEALAWSMLATLTADQIGTCPITVRPCAQRCTSGTWVQAPLLTIGRNAPFSPYISSTGAWVNGCGCSGDSCSCSALSEAVLPGPVGDIASVWLDGVELAPSAYRVDDGNRLVRTDGGTWPACQDLSLDFDGVGAFAVIYYQGAAPDEVISRAAGVLAVEYYKSCTGGKCRLPAGVRTITRQGIAMEVQASLFSDGITGITEVDVVVNRYNPNHLKMAPVVYSPDVRSARQSTWGRIR